MASSPRRACSAASTAVGLAFMRARTASITAPGSPQRSARSSASTAERRGGAQPARLGERRRGLGEQPRPQHGLPLRVDRSASARSHRRTSAGIWPGRLMSWTASAAAARRSGRPQAAARLRGGDGVLAALGTNRPARNSRRRQVDEQAGPLVVVDPGPLGPTPPPSRGSGRRPRRRACAWRCRRRGGTTTSRGEAPRDRPRAASGRRPGRPPGRPRRPSAPAPRRTRRWSSSRALGGRSP